MRLNILRSPGREQTEKMAAQSVNVLITGANRGLGLEMVGQMVKGSAPVRKLIACCRDPDGPRSEVSPELLLWLFPALPCCLQFCSVFPGPADSGHATS